MTESMLLQLLADLRTVFRATVKPVTLVSINEKLAKQPSANAIRYSLRVIDIMVNMGELTRDINVDGGRCTYLPTGKDNRDTGRSILAAFKIDLEEAAAVATMPVVNPAAEKAALARDEAAAPVRRSTPVNRALDKPSAKPAAKAPSAKPSTKISLRPGSARTRVLTVLQKSPQTRGKLNELLPEIGSKALDATLFTLRSDGLALRPQTAGAAWTISALGSELLQAIAEPLAAPPKRDVTHSVGAALPKTVQAWTDEVRQALEKMRIAAVNAGQQYSIDDLELKDFTLESLAGMADPAVASVLERIRVDLKKIATPAI